MRRVLLGVAAAAMLLSIASPAFAQTVSGDCVATDISGTSFSADGAQLDSSTVADATRSDPFLIDPGGSVSWDARTTRPITDHTWHIGPVIGGLEISLFSGGDPNTAETVESTGRVDIASRIDEIQTESVGWITSSLVGILQAWGRIEGDGSCEGRAWVKIEGSPLSGVLGQGALGAMVVGAGLLTLAAVKKA
jgi:hypothetical protein